MVHPYARRLDLHREPFYPSLTADQLRQRSLFADHFSTSPKPGKPPRETAPSALPASLSARSDDARGTSSAAGSLHAVKLHHPSREAVKLRGRVRQNGLKFNSSGARLVVASRDSVLLLHAYNIVTENQINSPGVSLVLPHNAHPDVVAVAGQEAPRQSPYIRIFDVRVPFSSKASSASSRDTPVLEFWGPAEEAWWTGCWSIKNDKIVCVDRRDVLHVVDLPAAVQTPQRTAISIPASQQVIGARPASLTASASSAPAKATDGAKNGALSTPSKGSGSGKLQAKSGVALSAPGSSEKGSPSPRGPKASASRRQETLAASRWITTRQLPGVTNSAAFSASGELLLLGQDDGSLKVFPANPLLPLADAPFSLDALHPGGVTCVAADPTNAFVASGGNEQLVNLLDAETLAVVGSFGRTGGAVQALDFSFDGRLLGWGCREHGAGALGGNGADRDGSSRESAEASLASPNEESESFLTLAGTDPCEIYFQCPTASPVAALAFHPSRYICAFATETDPTQSPQTAQTGTRAGSNYWAKQAGGAAASASVHPLGILTFE
ncbi:conserved hypothetical protein [Neospora caninum Liverpool]|uniref:WD40 repeat-like protein n=1 Tax=Neospora caninum (strain Liverpool) TaxID=572307 RepID=F0V9I5_NEOCL|nr:conserved hypothetical protein [Neospora caninum Liverpool]CBZ50410.1 conserved hypothetical protein [Neospora caninum Liverpool]CEL65018.1 TPA: hypothetical protein BN1204_008790 [Neospora caninum Liverpool]|eukprot:XP_003880444.1 conserved hypothetical protein [Neospora caninum Liverpool]